MRPPCKRRNLGQYQVEALSICQTGETAATPYLRYGAEKRAGSNPASGTVNKNISKIGE